MFTKDSRTENFLTQMGVEYRYTNAVTFGSLVRGWETINLARPVPKREDAILEYATLMENGSAAPAPILHDTGHGLSVMDGLQRLAAAQLNGYSNISAYVVTCDSEDVVTSIRVLANARLQGRAEPPEWTRRRAVEVLVVERGMSVAEVAKLGGWRAADIERIATSLDWGFKIRCIGGPNELPDSMIEVISRHTTQEELSREPYVIAEFLSMVKQAQFSAADAEPYVEEFFAPIHKPSKLRETYSERLADFQAKPEVSTRILGRRGAAMPKDVNLRRLLKAAATVIDEIAEEGEPVVYIDEFFRLVNTLDSKLHQIAKRHKKAVTPRTPADKWAKT